MIEGLRMQPWALAGLAALAGLPARAEDPPVAPSETIEIIGTSPLPGQGVPRDQLPYNTQLLRRGDIDAAQADNLSNLLLRRAAGVQMDDVQGSPYQGDLTFRGQRASGLLGAAQGLSVYLDGIRMNEPFGDVVNWDLIPEFALASVALVPGANPAYGLNTLGGAIAMTTLDGRRAPGVRAEVSLGSFGRRRIDASVGGSDEDDQFFVALGGFDEDGWRRDQPGRLGTVLAKASRRTDVGEFGLSALFGTSRLVGNGLVPLDTFDDEGERTPDLLRHDYKASYTSPDLTRNKLGQVGASWRWALDADSALEALVFWRDARRTTINGDEAEDDDEDEGGGGGDDDDGDDAPNATFNRTATRQRSYGAAFAWSRRSGAHQWQVGASADHARVSYEQTEQPGVFDERRRVLPIEGIEREPSVKVAGRSTTFGVHATDTVELAPATHVTGTVRYNRVRVSNTLTGFDDGEAEPHPQETFTYHSVNPALGIAQGLGGGATLFANVARNARAPTVIELGCADPDEPCRLPSGLQADPYLKQVRSTTFEAGARWRGQGAAAGASASLTAYRTQNRDDILFSSVSVTGQLGYFRNFDRTRYQGVDLEAGWRRGALDLGLAYSLLDATYQADGVLRMGERNVQIHSGTRIAGIARHSLKLFADWDFLPGWSLGGDVQVLSKREIAGNEDGLLEDGDDERVRFHIPGYALLNLHASWKPAPGWEVFARVSNVFDRKYANFGALAATRFTPEGEYDGDERDALFVAPGTPRAFIVGVRATW